MIVARFCRSLGLGAVIAAVLVIVTDTAGHAALITAASAAHESPTRFLAGGFVGFTIGATVIVFVVLSVFRPRRRTRRLAPGPWEGDYPGQRGYSRPPRRRPDSWERQEPPPPPRGRGNRRRAARASRRGAR